MSSDTRIAAFSALLLNRGHENSRTNQADAPGAGFFSSAHMPFDIGLKDDPEKN